MAASIGQVSAWIPADRELQKYCDQVRAAVEKEAGRNFGSFTGLMYKKLCLLGGTTYYALIDIGSDPEFVYAEFSKVTGIQHPTDTVSLRSWNWAKLDISKSQ